MITYPPMPMVLTSRASPRRRSHPYDRTAHRRSEIEKIIKFRHEGCVPDTDDADIYLYQIACCLVRLASKRGKPSYEDLVDRLEMWCEVWAPEVSTMLRRQACKKAFSRKRIDKADECARSLRLSYSERSLLSITTIGAFDADKQQRQKLSRARKQLRDREKSAEKRAAAGAIPRAQYLAESLSAKKPWKMERISRRTWERNRQRALNDCSD
jgi:hypothetical protein